MRRTHSVVALVALLAAAGTAPALAANPRSTPATTTPFVGGTLNAIGAGDVDYLDPNVSYSSVGYLVARTYSRQLYSYPAVPGETTRPEPDLAAAMPVISNGGKTYTITIRTGADWNTTPARQVTAADEVRGVKATCNPAASFGGLPDFESLIAGMPSFCQKFARVAWTPAAISHFMESTSLPGVTAIDSHTVQFTLTHRASYFTDELTLPALSPRAIEMDSYLPGSVAEAQHLMCDGPYKVTTYNPTRSIILDRNPAWSSATDSLRAAYVDHIDITEGLQQNAITTRVDSDSPSADVGFDVGPSNAQAEALRAQHDPRLVVGSQYSSNPFLIFNTVSPTSHGAMKNADVRRAISDALNRHDLLKSFDGLSFGHPLSHVLPPGVDGSRNFDDYPHNLALAKRLLAASGHAHPTLKLLYRPVSASSTAIAHAVQTELNRAGITVKLLQAPGEFTIYTKYLEVPSAARQGKWDISMAGWGPDWYGDSAVSFFEPLFDGRIEPPQSSDFGLYNSPAENALIDRATSAGPDRSAALWAKADRQVMADAAIYPLDDPDVPMLRGTQVHNFVFMPEMQQGDYTNMWLTSSQSS